VKNAPDPQPPSSSPRNRGPRASALNLPLSLAAYAAIGITVPLLLSPFYVTLAGYIGLATLVALGLVLLTGISGQTSFGQASFVGLAAYATTLLTKLANQPPVIGLAAGLLVTGIVAWLLGLITARLSGHFLALVSVAWGISFFSLFGTLPLLHGFNGIGDIPPLVPATGQRLTLGVILAVVAMVVTISANLLDSRIGRAMRTLNGARLMGASMGIDTVRLSRQVFVIAALYAALAGFLFAHFQRFVSPTPFALGASIDYLFMAIIGGAEWLWGAPVGAALVVVLRDQFNDWIPRLTGRSGDFEALVFALVVIVLLQRAPEGLLPLLSRLRPRASPPAVTDIAGTAPALGSATAVAGAELLAVETISRNFGGLAAVRDVSFLVRAGEIVALIGPNGAGKTTLFNLISGVLAPSAGTVRLFGSPAAHLSPHRIAALGLARSFQHVRLLGRRSVLENIALGAHLSGRAGLLHAMLRLDRAEERALLEHAHVQGRRVGLEPLMNQSAGDLPLGQQRLVEIARALCLRPRLLLLDEPAAGLRLAEKRHLATLLHQLRGEGMGVLLVEHDMDFVMGLADRVVVMDFGQKIAEGPPERVQSDPAVMEAYLGTVA
jgi:ABC-type branched-subunit amino acid transport system ATPase component/ABC-type branched-subunit amino acid transport system permease subunit